MESNQGTDRPKDGLVLLGVIQASLPLDHGIILSVTEAGVEPAKSPGSRPGRSACLRTRPWRVRGLHPAVQAYEARMSTGPPASSCRPRYRTGHTGHDQPSVGARSRLGTSQTCNRVTKGRVELPRPDQPSVGARHDVLSVACLPIPPLRLLGVDASVFTSATTTRP
jgi:hypothetical protein